MDDILIRRREMAETEGSPLPEWDVEWDYTMGLPTEDGLFSVASSGTASADIEADDLKITVSGANSYLRYLYDNIYTDCVLEVHILQGGSTNLYWIFGLTADGTNGIAIRCQYSQQYKGIYLATGTDSTIANMTKIGEFTLATEYTIRLVINNGIGSVYVNDVLLASNVPIDVGYGQLNRIEVHSLGAGPYYGRIYSIKMKLGRS